ncbi:MAG: hypothetical protein FOGNACKC_06223 [Anaerolineae bacterium]|nr:hypothetical protein [Anaerolineae bacterium]
MMKNANALLIGLAIMLAVIAVLGFWFGSGCNSGLIVFRIGDSYICDGPEELPPCPNPADCVRDVAKLVSVEAYPVQAQLEVVNKPDVTGTFADDILSKLGLNERIVILAYGRVVAGFDLTKIKDGDVWADGKHIRIQLPPPEILYDPIIDPARTQIISDRGFCPDLVCPKSIELAGPMLAEAQEKMRASSVQDLQLLDRAADSARASLTRFFNLLGFEEVEILIDQHPL